MHSNAVENNYLTSKQLIEIDEVHHECGDEICKQHILRPLQKSPSFDSQNQNTGFLLFLPPIPPDFTQIPP